MQQQLAGVLFQDCFDGAKTSGFGRTSVEIAEGEMFSPSIA
jgi:hypothetical protein